MALNIPAGSTGSNPASSLNNEDIHARLIPAGRMLPFLVVTVLFFLWAIPNNLNDILIRQFMKSFDINRSSAAAIQIWFYLGYFTLAIPAAQLMRRVRLQDRHRDRACSAGERMLDVLSGGAGGALHVLSGGAVCHRQRPLVS